MDDADPQIGPLPDAITLDEAFRAAYYLTEQYLGLESNPDEGLVLFFQYLSSDPARWDDWKQAVRTALADGAAASRLEEDLAAEITSARGSVVWRCCR